MKLRNELKAGIFLSASLFMIAALILIMGRERQIFAKQSEYHVYFKDVKGLSVGAPVRLGGISIGRVAEVAFDRNHKEYKVHVTLLINDKFLDEVKPDSTVLIDTQGLLGDRFISLTPGNLQEAAAPGTQLTSAEIADFGQILLRAQVVSAIKTENGFIHRLIYNESDGKKMMNSITSTSQDLADIMQEVRAGKGLLHGLVYEQTGQDTVAALFKASRNVSNASENLSLILQQTREGSGLVHDLLYTEVQPGAVSKRIEEILSSFAQTGKNFQVASEALSRGTGTLGALLVDPKLYDNLTEITDGAKRSFLLRQAVRSSLNQ